MEIKDYQAGFDIALKPSHLLNGLLEMTEDGDVLGALLFKTEILRAMDEKLLDWHRPAAIRVFTHKSI